MGQNSGVKIAINVGVVTTRVNLNGWLIEFASNGGLTQVLFEKRLTLNRGCHAFVLDTTRCQINTYV